MMFKKLLRTILGLPFMLIALWLPAQGIQFFEGTFAEAVEAAKKENKLVFVDAYATWCGPCKKMSRDVFPVKEVGDYFNRYFINLKLDMERGDGLVFREKYPVSAFPTLFFIDGEGEMVYKSVGGKAADQLVKLGQFALQKIDDSPEYEILFDEGERDPAFVLKYITALNKAGKPSLKVVNTYLNETGDVSGEENLKIIYEGTTEADSRVFDLLIQHRPAIEKLFSPEAVVERIELACAQTLVKAITYNVEDLYLLSIDMMEKHVKARADQFKQDADLKYFEATGQTDEYLKACISYAKTNAKNDPKAVANLAQTMASANKYNPKAIETAIDMAEMAVKHADSYEPSFVLAQLHQLAGNKKEAIKAAEKAKKLAGEQENVVRYIDSFIESL